MSAPYIRAVLEAYHALPHTPRRASRNDRLLAASFASRGVPLETVKAAFLIATARRTFRAVDAFPLGAIRSLAYFIPVVDELLAQPPQDPTYLDYIRRKLVSTSPTH
ncbi:MAG: hypothetical protein HY238_07215 [Acidobacteria bacterium]|nr:hypothetical protein [Acidobacteriota bacterium]